VDAFASSADQLVFLFTFLEFQRTHTRLGPLAQAKHKPWSALKYQCILNSSPPPPPPPPPPLSPPPPPPPPPTHAEMLREQLSQEQQAVRPGNRKHDNRRLAVLHLFFHSYKQTLSAHHALINAGERDSVKEGGGEEGERERERAVGPLLCHSPRLRLIRNAAAWPPRDRFCSSATGRMPRA